MRMTGVCMMVTPRKKAELEKLAAAEESSRLKDEFLATLSHELRTPLNAILGWAHMLEGGLSPDKTRRAIDVIGRNARLQAQLIEDVLDVSRIIVGKLDVEHIPLSVPQLVDAVVADESPAFSAKRIRFEKRIDAEVGSIEGDPRRLHQVLSNVLSNAVKFTPEGGSIALECSARPPSIEIQIRDSGEGIASEFLPFVFDRFRQADSRTTRKHGGLGLGLAIARHLVEQHGGSICTESDGPGLGTTVTIRLPAASPVWWASTLGALPAPSAEEVRLDDVTILVVDDQPDSREVVARLLEQRGARVQQCDCASSALEILDSEAPVHLLDCRHRHARHRRLRADSSHPGEWQRAAGDCRDRHRAPERPRAGPGVGLCGVLPEAGGWRVTGPGRAVRGLGLWVLKPRIEREEQTLPARVAGTRRRLCGSRELRWIAQSFGPYLHLPFASALRAPQPETHQVGFAQDGTRTVRDAGQRPARGTGQGCLAWLGDAWIHRVDFIAVGRATQDGFAQTKRLCTKRWQRSRVGSSAERAYPLNLGVPAADIEDANPAQAGDLA